MHIFWLQRPVQQSCLSGLLICALFLCLLSHRGATAFVGTRPMLTTSSVASPRYPERSQNGKLVDKSLLLPRRLKSHDFSLAALPLVDLEVLRIMSDQATGNGESTKQVVETATTVAGTLAIGAVISFVLIIVLPVFIVVKALLEIPTAIIEEYKTNFPDAYEEILVQAKAAIENDADDDDDDDDDDDEAFEDEADFFWNFFVAYSIIVSDAEDKTIKVLTELLRKSFRDIYDEEIATMTATKIVKEFKEQDAED